MDLIRTKPDGGELGDAVIDWVVAAHTAGEVAEEQMSALAMAILLRDMSGRELSQWTAVMIASGERLDFSELSRTTADSAPGQTGTDSGTAATRWGPGPAAWTRP